MTNCSLTLGEKETILGHLSNLEGEAFDEALVKISEAYVDQEVDTSLLRRLYTEYTEKKSKS